MAAKKKAVKPPKTKTTVKRKRVRIKVERTVRGLYREILDAFQEIHCKNRNKVIKFILALSENGGNQTQAALDAGYGNAKNSENITDERRAANAASEAVRLLKNAKVKKAYGLLCENNDIVEIVNKVTTKDRIVALLVERALYNFETSPNSFRLNLELVAKLKGYLEGDDPSKTGEGLRSIIVQSPLSPERNRRELLKLQEQGFFEDQEQAGGSGNVIDGEIVEG